MTLKSGGWRPSTIGSTTLGDKNPSGISRRTDRRSMPSRRASSSTDRTRPESRSSDHLRARATALSSGRSTRLGLESPSSTIRISTPRLFICMGTSLVRARWLALAPLRSSVGRSGTLIESRIPSRLSSTRSASSASADGAPLSARSLSIHPSVDFRTDGSRFSVDTRLLARLRDCMAVGKHRLGGGRDRTLDLGRG